MKNSQVINTVLIVLGGGILLYAIAVEGPHHLIKIAGLVIIMFGLFRATNFWVDTKDDHKEEEKEQ